MLKEIKLDNVIEEEQLQPLVDFLRDFTYRSRVTIVEDSDGNVLFKGTINKYYNSELKNEKLNVVLVEALDGEFTVSVR